MATLSLVELYVKNLMQNGFVEVTVAMCIGAVVYMVLEPLLPKTEALEAKVEKQGSGGDDVPTRMSKARLMRLGILMAITMTLHNLPEGFAVAFSSFTGIGPVMAAAIGVHNIPEQVFVVQISDVYIKKLSIIVAAPVYAATGSRRYALMLATASGLSEPVGAFIALFFIKPYLTPKLLHYLLAEQAA